MSLSVALPGARAADPSQLCFRGINISGAEYGNKNGVHGTNYLYPTETTVKYFRSKGMDSVRLPFIWERLQPQLGGRLNSRELKLLTDSVELIRKHEMAVILDPHNFGYYDGKQIGSAEVPVRAFADFWTRLAAEFANRDGLVFGLMNEPYDIGATDWLAAANAAIRGIRAVKADNLILVPGTIWSGAHSWEVEREGGSNGAVMLGVEDPRDNYAYELHQYLDNDYSGTKDGCVNAAGANQAIVQMTDWLRRNGKRGFVGEFGGGQGAACLAGLATMVGTIERNNDVWLGWTYWAAGDWWPEDETNNVQPTRRGERKQLQAIMGGRQEPGLNAGHCAMVPSSG
ncbi:glycoside hydrolase family 5 protein [Rhizobiaceae bacterium n13]|uniref:Glycoside hydrolase family 5 protein n=1 Tax=Ferirhizobium litorale TaxID=2927786 RepID=A0AAE3Q9G7_9HYPH|nr:glycoside hydrolase family 5 protein [Fererhizobium litorale]MDI7860622.1 glycoside hydrolase family 5 protein [Fererhizobium litorale]MDI7920770.1 glycoside hydrolase family 5 protein [Fererhizobium litorale]